MKRLLLLSLLLSLPLTLSAQTAARPGSITDMAFIEGHWLATTANGTVEAYWAAPATDNIAGFIRMMKDGKATLYELFAFEQTGPELVALVKHFKPGLVGVEEKDKSDRYTFLEAGAGRAVFVKQGEPLRVLYEKRGDDRLVIALGREQDGKWAFKDLFDFKRVK
jgi:hypothetical protein